MAHTLKINGGSLGAAINLADTASTGYHLYPDGYAPATPDAEVEYNASGFVGGNTPVFERYPNVTENITVEIIGSSVNDAFVKLRALKAILWEARDTYLNPGIRQPIYLEYLPQGCTNTCYSAILGGSVQEGRGVLDTDLLSYIISDVVITIEREPWWREKPPVRSATATDYAVESLATTTNASGFGSLAMTGGRTVPGDIPALMRWRMGPSATTTDYTWCMVGYRSARRGANHASGGIAQCEAMTPGTDTSATTDATASPGSGNTKLRCTFATVATNLERATYVVNPVPEGTWRVMMRAKLSAAGACTSQIGYIDSGKAYIYNANVTISSTSWAWYDMGLVTLPLTAPSMGLISTLMVAQIGIFAAQTSSTPSLDMDLLFLVPVDEYCLIMRGTVTYASADTTVLLEYSNLVPLLSYAENFTEVVAPSTPALGRYYVGSWQGDLRLPPGDGTLYFITGVDGTPITSLYPNAVTIQLLRCALYLDARGNG